MNKFPRVKADFIIEGINLNLEEVTRELNILSTETRYINDWPKIVLSSFIVSYFGKLETEIGFDI